MKKIDNEGIKTLMENLWLRHQAGMRQSGGNIYEVELPPPTAEELAEARRRTEGGGVPSDEPEKLYGAWI